MSGYASHQRGFTLVSLILTIVIMGLLISLGIPTFTTLMKAHRLNGAARQFMGDLMWARMQAVNQGNEFKVFILDTHQYKILDDDDNDGTADAGEWSDTRSIQTEFAGVTFSATADPIFFPRGTATGATITFTKSGSTKTVKVHITGRVKIE